MKYALGNMLNGAGSLNPDGLSLDLQFATDKTLAARKGPTPVFTRGSTGTFVGSNGLIQSAAINAARFDHDPLTLACKGLLIEEARTNLTLQSESFDNASWTKSNTTVTANSTTSPDGNTTADTFTGDGSLNSKGVLQTGASSLINGTVYTTSIYAKKNTNNFIQITGSTAPYSTINVFANFDLNSGVVGTIGSAVTATITNVGNGWYRCTMTATATVTTNTNIFIVQLVSSATALRGEINTVSTSVFLWGAQLEAGSFPTSYIPTVASSVVRSADVCSITGSDFSGFYNQSEGTIYTESRPATVNGTTTVFGVSNGTANERWLNRFAQNEQLVVTSSGIESALDALNPVAGTLYKVASAAKLNDIAMSMNGLSVLTDTSQPMPTVDRATIGSVSSTVASIRYYKKRLTNAKLQTLTT
jgi:hypothetical protein